ncbi:MAG: triose-phosphate isomerase [Candidatus Hodarchaeales archaeon]
MNLTRYKKIVLPVKQMRRYVCGGNWKMSITSVNEAKQVVEEMLQGLSTTRSVDVFIAPSFNALYPVGEILHGSNLKLAGQNMYFHENGAFTGQISPLSLIDANCEYVILGHSEPRRLFGESDQLINKKLLKAIETGLYPVLCIGETAKEREDNKTEDILHTQLSNSLEAIKTEDLNNVIIAYEPVWAINNKFLNPDTAIRPATRVEAENAHTIVREWFSDNFGSSKAEEIPIIYGGSMNAENARELLSIDQIDGGLIGGASLSAEKFLPIVRIAESLSGKKTQNYRWENNTLRFNN